MSAYRSRSPGGHIEGIDELEAKLRRGVRRRRLVMGFLALVVGCALIASGVVLILRPFGGRGLVRAAILSVATGGALLIASFIILRVGEMRHGGDVVEVDPIPWSTLGGVSAGLLIVFGVIAAWPLGVYRWLDTLRSPCRPVITAADASALNLKPFDVGHVQNDTLGCKVTGMEPGAERRVVSVVLAADKGGTQFPNELRFLGGTQTSIEGLGDEAYLIEREGEHIVIVRRRHAAMLVHLASWRYDRAAALRVADHAKTRMSLLEPYADTWKKKYGSD